MLKKALLAGTAMAALAGATFAYAQNADTKTPNKPAFTAEDRAAFAEGRIAGIKAALQLTAAQEKNWPPVEKALRELADQRSQMREMHRTTDFSKMDPVEQLRFRASHMNARAESMTKLADAAEPLYKSLDEAQKRRVTFLIQRGGHHFGPHHASWHHRGRHHGGWHHGGPGGEFGRGGMGGPGMGGPGMGPGMGGPGMGRGMGPGGEGMGPGPGMNPGAGPL